MAVSERATVPSVAERKAQRLDDARLSTTLVAAGLGIGVAVCFLLGASLGSTTLVLLALGLGIFSAALTGAAVVLSALRDSAREEAR